MTDGAWLGISYMVIGLLAALTVREGLSLCLRTFVGIKKREKLLTESTRLDGIEERLERVESVTRAINLTGRLKR